MIARATDAFLSIALGLGILVLVLSPLWIGAGIGCATHDWDFWPGVIGAAIGLGIAVLLVAAWNVGEEHRRRRERRRWG